MQRTEGLTTTYNSYRQIHDELEQQQKKVHETKAREIQEIACCIEEIRAFLNSIMLLEPKVNYQFATLLASINEFEALMKEEVTNKQDHDWRDPVLSTHHLKETIKIVFDVHTTFDQKEKAINEFEYETRNARFTERAKKRAGFISGLLIGFAATAVGLAFAIGPFAILAFPLIIMGGLICGLIGRGFASPFSIRQDDYRGKDMANSLHTLNQERANEYGNLFAVKKPQTNVTTKVGEEATPVLKSTKRV